MDCGKGKFLNQKGVKRGLKQISHEQNHLKDREFIYVLSYLNSYLASLSWIYILRNLFIFLLYLNTSTPQVYLRV